MVSGFASFLLCSRQAVTRRIGGFAAFAAAVLTAGALQAQQDPGPRPGPAGAGGPFPTLNADEQNVFNHGLLQFQKVFSVSGTIEPGKGLGPAFNGNSCALCHSQPATGGTGPGLASPQNPVPNPEVAVATLDGATNHVPSFITASGPAREARFVLNPDGTLDGKVHDLYTIAGRTDAPGCRRSNLPQPPFAQQLAANNVIFRIPTPVFGAGLVENTPDSTLQANLAATDAKRASLGIGGRFNVSGNDGTITRFGWKAQNKLGIFPGEASNVELGLTNELFPNERTEAPGCLFNATPEDTNHILNPDQDSRGFGTPVGTMSDMISAVANLTVFIRLSAPPQPVPLSTAAQNGKHLFNKIGCSLCHSHSLTTAASPFTGMGGATFHPLSDFALHHMGSNLADGIDQGVAGPDEFRSAPLWGVGQRLFFLHDGRTSDLLQAILAHASSGSEANAVIGNFLGLTPKQKQDVLDFLRSL